MVTRQNSFPRKAGREPTSPMMSAAFRTAANVSRETRLFTKAEPAKQRVEKILNTRPPADAVDGLPGNPQILGDEHRVGDGGGSRQGVMGLRQEPVLAAVEG